MLTAYQLALIDALPAEGGAYYSLGGQKIAYPQEDISEMARLPLPRAPRHGTLPELTEKKAIILHGAPGSGKTYDGMKRLEALVEANPDLAKTFAVISYDEHGAMYDIPEYVTALHNLVPDMRGTEDPVNAATLAARKQLWLDFQPLGQNIRSETLKLALQQERNVYIDTTSSSMGTMKLIELLRNLDYSHIEFWSYSNPLLESAARIENRLRPTSDDDLFNKRIGAYEMLPKIVAAADRVSLSLNDTNDRPAQEFAVFRAGQFMSGHGDTASSLVARLALEQPAFLAEYVKRFGEDKALEASTRMKQALDGFNQLVAPALLSRIRSHHVQLSNDLT